MSKKEKIYILNIKIFRKQAGPVEFLTQTVVLQSWFIKIQLLGALNYIILLIEGKKDTKYLKGIINQTCMMR